MKLAGQTFGADPVKATKEERALGAQLLLSEVLEYVIKGLGVTPEVKGVAITEPEGISYKVSESSTPDKREMLDGLADVAYTMYWNAVKFGVRLEEGFELVCRNNLDKFIRLSSWDGIIPAHGAELPREQWHCYQSVSWPSEVVSVTVIEVSGTRYAVGKDGKGKVRKPSTYKSVDLSELI